VFLTHRLPSNFFRERIAPDFVGWVRTHNNGALMMTGRTIVRLASVAAIALAPTIAWAVVSTDAGGYSAPSAAKLYPASPSTEASGTFDLGVGMTSGPAVGTPTTLGTSGLTAGSPHQLRAVRDQSSSVTREAEQSGSSGANQLPNGPAVGIAGMPGSKSGPATATTSYKPKHYPNVTEESSGNKTSVID
jgi:hypothetical protein